MQAATLARLRNTLRARNAMGKRADSWTEEFSGDEARAVAASTSCRWPTLASPHTQCPKTPRSDARAEEINVDAVTASIARRRPTQARSAQHPKRLKCRGYQSWLLAPRKSAPNVARRGSSADYMQVASTGPIGAAHTTLELRWMPELTVRRTSGDQRRRGRQLRCRVGMPTAHTCTNVKCTQCSKCDGNRS